MKIADKIYKLRTEAGMTQIEFADIAGVSDKAVSTWERGKKEPRMKPLQLICVHFGIDINQFVDTESDVYKNMRPTTVSDDGPVSKEDMALLKSLSKADRDIVLSVARQMKQKEKEQGQ